MICKKIERLKATRSHWERQLHYNYLYRWFLGLSFYDGVPDRASLSVFRSRIGEEAAREIFEAIVRQARDAGVLVGRVKAVDATHVEANCAKSNVVNLLSSARRKILGMFRKERGEQADEIEKECVSEKKSCHKSTDSETTAEV